MKSFLLLVLFNYMFAYNNVTTKEIVIYKSNDEKSIDISQFLDISNNTYKIELIDIKDLQYKKDRKNAIEFCELEFYITDNFSKTEEKPKTIIQQFKKEGMKISICEGDLVISDKPLSINKNNSIIYIDSSKYSHLSCSLVFWVTGVFIEEVNTGNIKDNGVLREWYSDNKLYIEYKYKNAKKNGVQKRWYDNGQLDIKYYYKNGKLHGEQKRWYKNGVLKFTSNYINDELHGIFKEWYSNGQIKEIREYKFDELVEVLESYDINGLNN